jgi:hypothetical protein
MKIALDLDDTITACPDFFVEMAAGLRSREHEIYILTFRREREEIFCKMYSYPSTADSFNENWGL